MSLSVLHAHSSRRYPVAFLVLLAFMFTPLLAQATGDNYLLVTATRMVAFAIAAVALDLILGFGAMVSFGHAAYVGLGAYSVAIAMRYGVTDVFAHLAIAMSVSAFFALATGALSLRTSGIYFIMITLAFGQMAYFFFVSLSAFGGDDGTALEGRSSFFGTDLLAGDTALFYASLTALALVYLFASRLVQSRFGRVLIGTRENPVRMAAIGFETFRFRLFAYVLSGSMASITGVILANQSYFVAPAFMTWQRSGELMVMVVLGGMGNLVGSIIGASVTILLEDWLSLMTVHWRLPFGILLVALALSPTRDLRSMLGRLKEARA